MDTDELLIKIRKWAEELGFQQLGISDIELREHQVYLQKWLDNQFHGEMDFMQKHGLKRSRPEELHQGTLSVISVRMDYLPEYSAPIKDILANPNKGYISRYALGRDYHKKIRKLLDQLAKKIKAEIQPDLNYRVFTDSAPVLERALAEKADLGWIGKNTCLINTKAGSWFFLGEIFSNIPFSSDHNDNNHFHCGSCMACIDICPTKAIVAPFKLDARKCISYLTIEHKGSIPEVFRKAIGNRIYGCDDCQLICPWNKFAQFTLETDFEPRHQLDQQDLLDLLSWDENEFLNKTEGSAIRRIGYPQWIRNIAVALGNSPRDKKIIKALKAKQTEFSLNTMVKEHIEWALIQQTN